MMRNTVQLISYADRLSGAGIPELHELLITELKDLFSGVHVLPYFYPIDGSDAGFDPIEHTRVDPRVGDWHHVQALGAEFDVMSDLIVNHVSAESKEFKDVLRHGEGSVYWDLFLTQEKVFPQGMTDEEQAVICQPKAEGCFTPYQLHNGQTVNFWTTFTDKQIDIDVNSAAGRDYLDKVITTFASNNVKLIRLDAAGFAIKKAGTSCFMLDETFDFIDGLSSKINRLGMGSLVEVHSHYRTQIDIAKKVDLVYDFALPSLVLHALLNEDADPLIHWLTISPRNCITVLDTHDGIGVQDAAPVNGQPGLLDVEQVDRLIAQIHHNSQGESLQASGAAASNVDIYQVNCSYYDALAKDDLAYLMARAIQFFAPGVPQVYYAGLLARDNDMGLLARTNVGRDINRPYLDRDQVRADLNRPVVKALTQLIQLRNTCKAFGGEFNVKGLDDKLWLNWSHDQDSAVLEVNLRQKSATISLVSGEEKQNISLASLLNTHII